MPIEKKIKVVESWGWQIVILQRGWVYVGRMTKTGHQCQLDNASCIGRWGTKNGLGELASSGPLPETKLEPCKLPVRFHYLTTIACIECEASKWN
jgi:hypothetical protein